MSQLAQWQARRGPIDRSPVRMRMLQLQVLDESQRMKLALIERVLYDEEIASQAVALGLIQEKDWLASAGNLCQYPLQFYASRLGLSDSQVLQIERAGESGDMERQRKLALSMLDERQRAKFAAFQSALSLAVLAVELGLILPPSRGEVLCH